MAKWERAKWEDSVCGEASAFAPRTLDTSSLICDLFLQEEKERKEEEAKMIKDKKKDKKDGTSRIPAPKRLQTKIPTANKEKIGSGNQAARKGATAGGNTSVKSGKFMHWWTCSLLEETLPVPT
jgi:hypothetical protein